MNEKQKEDEIGVGTLVFIKDLGIYQVKLNLHPEVSQTILINIARTSEEAKKQAKSYSQE